MMFIYYQAVTGEARTRESKRERGGREGRKGREEEREPGRQGQTGAETERQADLFEVRLQIRLGATLIRPPGPGRRVIINLIQPPDLLLALT